MLNPNPSPDNTATKDADIPTIFNPAKVRTPSVVVTEEDAPKNVPNGPVTNPSTIPVETVTTNNNSQDVVQQPPPSSGFVDRLVALKNTLISRKAKRIYYGISITLLVTGCWVGSTHFIKISYLEPGESSLLPPLGNSTSYPFNPEFDAPFFTTWFIATWAMLFFPVDVIITLFRVKNKRAYLRKDAFQQFRDKGVTIAQFTWRSFFFCLLWVATNYMYVHSLKILLATEVITLFATNVSCVYLLSWVILHEQFVGVRIVAVILCDTGIALLAYMDGITGSHTLGGVVLAACAGAGSAVYKVLFKKLAGDVTYSQVSMYFTMIGLIDLLLLWPICVALYFANVEELSWPTVPWEALYAAGILSLIANLFGNYGCAITYELFITLGLIMAVPVSASLDIVLYGAEFTGMKLAGIILITVGFFLVMLPENWPDYITRLLRNVILLSHSARWSRRNRNPQSGLRRDVVDYRTGYIRSHLRSPSGRVR